MSQPSPTGSPDEPTGLHAPSLTSTLRREAGVLFRSRRLIAACVTASVLAAGAYNYGSRPLYEATAIISLDEAGVSPLRARGAVDQTRRVAALDIQVRLLKSPELALVAVTGADSVLAEDLAKGALGDWKERLAEEARFRVGFLKEHGSELPDQVAAFRSRLSVEYEPPSAWVSITFTGYQSEAAVAAVNRLLTAYLAEAKRQTEGDAGATRQQIEGRVNELHDRAVESLGKLQEFERKEGLQGAETRRQALEKELARLQETSSTARQKERSSRALVEEAARLSTSEMLAIPSVRDDREVVEATNRIIDLETRIASLSATLGDKHPQIAGLLSEQGLSENRLAARVDAIREATARDHRMAMREEAELQATIDSTQRSIARLDKNSVEHTFIQLQAEAGQRAVGELIDKSVREAEEEVFFAPNVLQWPSLSQIPSSPQRTRNFQYALAFGVLLGLALAWLRAHLDETVKTPDDIKANFDVPLLGMVPLASSPVFDLFGPEEGVALRLFEAYRVARTNLTVGDIASNSHASLLITSSRAGEGKTTTTCGLGVTLARAGLRVLMVDGDLRRASLSRHLSAKDRPGLTDALDGVPIESCITNTSVPGLSLLPVGTSHRSPAEVLTRASLTSTMESIRPDYDWVLWDAPPLLAVADAAILCRLADSVLLVVGANSTPITSIRASLEQLSAVAAKVRGLVLNRIDLGLDSHYYRYYYASQYEAYPSDRSEPVAGGAR